MPNVEKHASEKDCPKECPLANTKQFMSVVFIICGSYGIMSLYAPFHAVSATLAAPTLLSNIDFSFGTKVIIRPHLSPNQSNYS